MINRLATWKRNRENPYATAKMLVFAACLVSSCRCTCKYAGMYSFLVNSPRPWSSSKGRGSQAHPVACKLCEENERKKNANAAM